MIEKLLDKLALGLLSVLGTGLAVAVVWFLASVLRASTQVEVVP